MPLEGLDEGEIIREFLKESLGSLAAFQTTLQGLQDKAPDDESLVSLRRSVHTISGTSGFLGFKGLAQLAHCGEKIIQSVQAGALTFDPPIRRALNDLGAFLKQSLLLISETGKEKPVEDGLLERLERIAEGSPPQ